MMFSFVLIRIVKDVHEYVCMCVSFTSFFCIYFMYVCGMCVPWHEWDVRRQLVESLLPLCHVGSGMKLTLSDLAASASNL